MHAVNVCVSAMRATALLSLVLGGLLAPDASARSNLGTAAACDIFEPDAKSPSLELPVARGMAVVAAPCLLRQGCDEPRRAASTTNRAARRRARARGVVVAVASRVG